MAALCVSPTFTFPTLLGAAGIPNFPTSLAFQSHLRATRLAMHDSGLDTLRHSQRSHALPVFITYPQSRVHRSVSSTNIAIPGPAPTLLIHRLDLHTSTPELSTLVQRDITSVGDALQFARDEEALVLFGESDGRGVSSLENGNRMHGKLKAKRNQDRNWWPCVKCKEKKLKVNIIMLLCLF